MAHHIGMRAVQEKKEEAEARQAAASPAEARQAKREEVEEGEWQAGQRGGREARHMKAEVVAASRRAAEHPSVRRDNHGRAAATSNSGSLQPVEHRSLPPENSSSAVQSRKRKRGDEAVALPSQATAVSSTADIRRPAQGPRPAGPQVRPAVAGGAGGPAPPAPPRPSPQPAPERAAPPPDVAPGGSETPDVDIGARAPVSPSPDHPVPAPQPVVKRRRRYDSESDYAPTGAEDSPSPSPDPEPRRSKRKVERPDYKAAATPPHTARDFLPAHRSGVTHVHPPSGAPAVPDPQSDPAILSAQDDAPIMPGLESNAARRTANALVAAADRGAAPVLPQADVYAAPRPVTRLPDRADQEAPDAPEAEVVGRRKKKEPIPDEKRSEVPTRKSGTVTQTQAGPRGRQAQTDYTTQSAAAGRAGRGRVDDTAPPVTWRLAFSGNGGALGREIFDGTRWQAQQKMGDANLAQAVHWHASEGEGNWPKGSRELDLVANKAFGYKDLAHMRRERFKHSDGNVKDIDAFRHVLQLGQSKIQRTSFLSDRDNREINRAHRTKFGGTKARPIEVPEDPEDPPEDPEYSGDEKEPLPGPSMVYNPVVPDDYLSLSDDDEPASVGIPRQFQARQALNRPRAIPLRYAYHEHRNRRRLEAARQALKNVNLNEHGRWTHGTQFRGSHGRNPTPRLSVQHLGPKKYIFRAYRGVSNGVREQIRHYLSKISKYVYLNGIRHNKKQAFTAMIDLLRTNKGVEVQIQ